MKTILKWLITIIIIMVLFIVGINHYNTYKTKETSIKDHVFRENIENMYDGAKSYFGYNIKLPTKNGEELKVSLETLVKEHIILMPLDSNNKECNGKESYATVTKINGGYKIKVSLTCQNVSDYIIRIESCNPYCTTGCLKEEPKKEEPCKNLFEYKKVTEAYLTDWSSWSKYQTEEIKEKENLQVQTKIEKNQTCENGYTLQNGKCIKKYTETKKEEAKLTYSCKEGYQLLNGECVRNYTETKETDAKLNLSCENGYTLKDNKCVKNYTETKEATKTYTCTSGKLQGTKCIETITKTLKDNQRVSFSCEEGYTLTSNNKCTKQVEEKAEKKETLYCESTYNLSGGNCVKTQESYYKTCKNGTLENGKCVDKTQCSISYVTECNDTCKIVKKETCKTEEAVWATNYKTLYGLVKKSYTCPDGFQEKKLNENSNETICIKSETKETDAKRTTYCQQGYKLDGYICTKQITETKETDAKVNYSCQTGTLENNICKIAKTETKEAKKTYTCDQGTLQGTICKTQEAKTNTIEATKNYYCTTGKLEGTTCIKEIQKEETKDAKVLETTYYRYRTRRLVEGGTTIRWSESEKDTKLINAGYKLTGNTKFTCAK